MSAPTLQRPLLREGARWIALALTCAVLWCLAYNRWTRESWSYPIQYSGDTYEVLARLQAASEGDLIPFAAKGVDRLGAPFEADWNAYPMSDEIIFFLLGQIARLIGLMETANLAVLLAHVAAALAFYGCARFLRYRWEWAFATALLFSFLYFHFFRGLGHLTVAFSFTVPLALLSTWLVAVSRRIELGNRESWICLGSAAALGISNPYNLFLFLQLMTLSLVAQALRDRRHGNLKTGLASLALALALFLALQLDTWMLAPDEGAAPLMVRNYAGTEVYALKPIELVIPPTNHEISAFSFFGYRYGRWSAWRGETFSPYLGVVGGVALLWMLAAFTTRLIRARRPVTAHAPQALWILAYSSMGGLNNLAALFFGFNIFRATNRYSVFLAALALLFLASRFSSLSRRWPRGVSLAGAAVLLGLGLYEQIPNLHSAEAQRELVSRVRTDREFARLLESSLPAGAALFQLPQLDFPEASPPEPMSDYEHFRPFFFTETLRFSYGALRGRTQGRWQREVKNAPPHRLVRRLESAGFSGIYLNRKGFADRGEALLKGLAEAGRSQVLEAAGGDQLVVLLQPADSPRLPFSRRLTFGQKWHRGQGAPRWSWDSASLSYFNPHQQPVEAEFHISVGAVDARPVTLKLNGKRLWSGEVGTSPQELTFATILLKPGVNRFDLETPAPSVRTTHGQDGLRSLAVYEVVIRPVLPSD